MNFPRVASLKTAEDWLQHLQRIGVHLPFEPIVESGSGSPLGRPLSWQGGQIGNRFAILPMEGWDGTEDGQPSDLTRRRWENFGRSGAKLIWGGEAIAVRHDGRANPNQLVITERNVASLAELRELLVRRHAQEFGRTEDLLVGLQLTHSGRFARPNDKKRLEPLTLYRHPFLERKYPSPTPPPILTDDEIRRLIDDFIIAAECAYRAGYAFVDIKHCHGYLGHEFLSARDRPGDYGGDLSHRMRFLREVVQGIRARAPQLHIGVRLSIFDTVPYQKGPNQVGEPMPEADGSPVKHYRYGFGVHPEDASQIDLTETKQFLAEMRSLGLSLLCTTAGSPYYNPHCQRPAAFPPSDGYLPPEDPLVGVARQIQAQAELKRAFPDLVMVGSGYSYLQEWLPNVAQAVVRSGMSDCIGLGRMVLAYPELPADVLAGRPLARKKICRTFSDCTTAPRNGMVSGCYPLDPFYKSRPERETLLQLKQAIGMNE